MGMGGGSVDLVWGMPRLVVGCMAAEPILDGDKKRKESTQAGGEASRSL